LKVVSELAGGTVLVRNDDQRVDMLLKLGDPESAERERRAFETKGLVTTPTVRIPLSRVAWQSPGSTGARATAHPRGGCKGHLIESLRQRRGLSPGANRRQ
jgi:hypothetical protein